MSISVVIPLYNKELYIKRAIDSVLTQTYSDFELVVVDDGSTDNGPKIVSAIKDRRIKLIQQRNGGESAARNRGITEAITPFVAFLDADDEWKPNFLETVLDLCQKFPNCGAYSTAWENIIPGGKIFKQQYTDIPEPPWEGIISNYFKVALHRQPICSSSAFIPRKVFDNVGLFHVGEALGEDLNMWCKIALKYPVAFSTKVCACYHQEAEMRVCNTYKLRRYEATRSIDDFLKTGEMPYNASLNDLILYKDILHIHCAINLLLNDMVLEARTQLQQCRFSKSEKKWILLYMLSYMPKYTSHIALWSKLNVEKLLGGIKSVLLRFRVKDRLT